MDVSNILSVAELTELFASFSNDDVSAESKICRVRPIRRSEIGKIGTHQKIGESDMCTVRFRFVCGRHAACQIN